MRSELTVALSKRKLAGRKARVFGPGLDSAARYPKAMTPRFSSGEMVVLSN